MMRPRDERGAAAVEFAVVLPLLLMVVFGIIEFGLLMYNKAMITNASREAARSGILFDNGQRLDTTQLATIVNQYCQNYLISFSDSSQSPVTTAVTESGAQPEAMSFGDHLTVTVTYRYDYLLMPNFIAGIGDALGGVTLVATTTMRAE